jgi:phage terminase large subunit-like protein
MLAASSRDQAEIDYRQGEGFVERSGLDGFRCYAGYRRIVYKPTGGRIQVFAADDRTGDGIIPTLCIIDELHRHRDMRLYRTWAGKLQKRKGQIVTISTAGEPGSEFEQTRERIRQDGTTTRKGSHIRAVLTGLVLHEWAVPEDGEVEDVRIVKRANPLKAVTVERLRDDLASPSMTLSHWRRFKCNLPTRSDDAAITEAEWQAAGTDEAIPEGEPIWIGLDVAWKWDTTAIVPLWSHDAGRLLGPAIILTPPRDGASLDPHAIERALTELDARNPIHTVVMDPSRAEQLGAWIEETFGSTVIARPQSPALAVVDFERFMEGLRTGSLKHSGDAGLTRHALNAVARVDRFGAARFDRSSPTRYGGPEQERRVIDALTAAAMVNAQASMQPEPSFEPMVAYR